MNIDPAGGVASAADLRALLHERFPEAHASARVEDGARLETGCAELDAIGIAKGSVTEIVQTRPSSGGALLITRFIEGAANKGTPLALIDGRDSLEPGGLSPTALQRLLWVRTSTAPEAIKAADFLLRDGNLPSVLIDLALNPKGEVLRVPDSSWQRLRALAVKTSTALLAFTANQSVPRPHLRILLQKSFTLAAFERSRDDIELKLHVARSTPAHLTKTA